MFSKNFALLPKLSTLSKPITNPIIFLYSTIAPTSQSHHSIRNKELDSPRDQVNVNDRSYWTETIHALCSKHRDVDGALRLLDRLTLRGYRPDSLNLSSVVHALCDAARFAEAHRRLSLSLDSDRLAIPDERTCNVLVARLLNGRLPDCTWRVVRKLVSLKPEFVPSLINYNRLIDQLCSVSRVTDGHWLLYHLQSRGHFPNSVSYTTLINGYCKSGDLVSAQKVFDEMRERGVLANSLTYSVLICGVLRMRDLDRGKGLMLELWERMKLENDQRVNHIAFANLTESLCREGFFGELFGIVEEMPQAKSVSDDFAYAQMIDSLCNAGRHHGASRVVYIMRKRGFVPGVVSYNNIVHGLCNEGGCMRAYQLLEEGIRFGYRPSEYTYKVLVECLCREPDIQKAKEVLRIMLNDVNDMDRTRIYNIYLRALCLIDNTTELLNVLVSMLQDKSQPDVITLNTVIKGLCEMGRVDEALKVLGDMMGGKFTLPDAVTFTTVIFGLLTLGRAREALDMFRRLVSDDSLRPGVVTYNAVVRGLFKLGRADEAMEIYNVMIGRGVRADCRSYSTVIEGLCRCDQIEEAKRFWDDIIWPSRVHDDFVYSAIVKGLCRSGNFNGACHFLYELVDSGVSPSNFSYNILIDCACKLGLKDEAYRVLREMKRNGLAPDAVTWRILDKLRNGSMKLVFVKDSSFESSDRKNRELEFSTSLLK